MGPSPGLFSRAWSRMRRFWHLHPWTIVALLWAAAMGLGYIGFSKYFAARGEVRSVWDTLYVTLQLFTVESGNVAHDFPISWQLETARLLAPATTLYTVFQALAIIFHQQLQHLKVRFYTGHIVICGLGRRGLTLARACCERGEEVVIIEKDENNDRIEACREHGAIIMIGDASDPEVLHDARVHAADHLVTLCHDDGVNAEVAVDASKLVEHRKGKPLNCIVQIVDSQLLDLLRAQQMGMGSHGSFRIEFFNVFERGARAILDEYPCFSQGMTTIPHILIVGVGRMGESLVAHAARGWRAYRSRPEDRMQITLVDRDAIKKNEYLQFQYPMLSESCDIRALEMDVKEPNFYKGEFLFSCEGCSEVTAIYVCLDNDTRAMAASLALLRRTRNMRIPIVVRMGREEGLAQLLHGVNGISERFSRLNTFGVIDRTCTPELILGGSDEILARSIHEEYVRTRPVFAKGQEVSASKPDPVNVAWKDLPDWIKDSFRNRADHITGKLKEAGYTIEPLVDWEAGSFQFSNHEIEKLARLEYREHLKEQIHGHWSYFPGYENLPDYESKRIPWEELPGHIREGYRQVVQNLPTFLAKEDFQISPIVESHGDTSPDDSEPKLTELSRPDRIT